MARGRRLRAAAAVRTTGRADATPGRPGRIRRPARPRPRRSDRISGALSDPLLDPVSDAVRAGLSGQPAVVDAGLGGIPAGAEAVTCVPKSCGPLGDRRRGRDRGRGLGTDRERQSDAQPDRARRIRQLHASDERHRQTDRTAGPRPPARQQRGHRRCPGLRGLRAHRQRRTHRVLRWFRRVRQRRGCRASAHYRPEGRGVRSAFEHRCNGYDGLPERPLRRGGRVRDRHRRQRRTPGVRVGRHQVDSGDGVRGRKTEGTAAAALLAMRAAAEH